MEEDEEIKKKKLEELEKLEKMIEEFINELKNNQAKGG